MRLFRTVSDGGHGLKFLATFAVIVVTLTANASGAMAFSTPTTVLTGLQQPAETAISRTGDIYFTQLVSPNTVTLSQLAPGSSTPVEVYRLSGFEPYLNDIHFDPAGNLIFITSVATGSSRQWALTRLNLSTGIASELVVTSGVVDPSAGGAYSGVPLLSGTEIDLCGVDRAGTIYFAEHSFDSGNQVSDLLALTAGTSMPLPIGHFANLIVALTVAKTGDVYFNENGDLYQYQLAAGTSRVLIASSSANGHPLHSGLDAAGNLYVIQRTFVGPPGFGQASSTIVRIVRISARDLASSNPTPVVISDTTYTGFIALWAGSSSFFRVSTAGDVYWVQSLVDPSTAIPNNQVIGITRGQATQSMLYEEFASQQPSSTWNVFTAAQGPIGLATGGGGVFASSTNTGELLQIRR